MVDPEGPSSVVAVVSMSREEEGATTTFTRTLTTGGYLRVDIPTMEAVVVLVVGEGEQDQEERVLDRARDRCR